MCARPAASAPPQARACIRRRGESVRVTQLCRCASDRGWSKFAVAVTLPPYVGTDTKFVVFRDRVWALSARAARAVLRRSGAACAATPARVSPQTPAWRPRPRASRVACTVTAHGSHHTAHMRPPTATCRGASSRESSRVSQTGTAGRARAPSARLLLTGLHLLTRRARKRTRSRPHTTCHAAFLLCSAS